MSILKSGKDESILPTLTTQPLYLKQNDLFKHVMAGGGGYGDPLEREPNLVLKDVIEEKISLNNASENYGVVIIKNSKNKFSIDIDATNKLRN